MKECFGRVIVVAQADSHLKWCINLASQISNRHVVVIPESKNLDLDSEVIDNIGANINKDAVIRVDINSLGAILFELGAIDAVIFILRASEFATLYHHVERLYQAYGVRPLLVTGFPGIAMKPYNVLMARQGADIICANTKKDKQLFQEFLNDNFGHRASQVVEIGFDFWLHEDQHSYCSDAEEITKIVFAPQPHWPATANERAYILSRLIEFATVYPGLDFYVKNRLPSKKRTIHPEKYPYLELYESFFPDIHLPNLSFVEGPMTNYISRDTLLLTLSSTAAMEALALGAKSAVIGDFFINETYGIDYFLGSNIITTFDKLIAGHIPLPCPDWVNNNGIIKGSGIENLAQLAKQIPRNSQLLPIGFSSTRFPYKISLIESCEDPVDRFTYYLSNLVSDTSVAKEMVALLLRQRAFSEKQITNNSFLMAKALFCLGMVKQARFALQYLIDRGCNISRVFVLYGRCCMDMCEFSDAVSAFTKAFELDPSPNLQSLLDTALRLESER